MKKYIILPLAAFMFSLTAMAQTQTGDVDPLINVKTSNENVKFSVGGRLSVDAANFSSDYTAINSGIAITDARIHANMYLGENWFVTADFDFSGGDFSQKDIYARYEWNNNWIKAGYFCEPSSMSLNTSRYNYQFISRPTSANALSEGRNLGIAYRFSNDKFFANQGVFAENKYNDQLSGYQGYSLSGRWLYKPFNNDVRTLHVGVSYRYAKIKTGEFHDGVLETSTHVGASLESYVTSASDFLSLELPWASDIQNVGVEALYKTQKFFVRGEYLMQFIGKDRDDQRLFENQLGTGLFASSTVEAWLKMNPLESNDFNGAYIEAGYLLMGDTYSYDNANGILGGVKGKNTLQVVARYGYTNLNQIEDGYNFSYAYNRFLYNNTYSDFAASTTSMDGGTLHSFTIGLNYGINNYMKVLVDYTHSVLDNVYFPLDENFGILQARFTVSF